jgi:hypothetical protein
MLEMARQPDSDKCPENTGAPLHAKPARSEAAKNTDRTWFIATSKTVSTK